MTKLYSESEVIKFINDNFDEGITKLIGITPIELPSDEEIEKASFTEKYQVAFNPFASGAKWVINKIGGNNE